jgi:HD-like signal output (HDOD) protein/CheY-like chemotaxis protein
MIRILFVDDEELILRGLRNLLRRHRNEWEMVFVSSGDEAIVQLRRAPFDVLVTDMRMPKMDGTELLTRAKLEFPEVVRIILSGHAEPESMRRALGVAQQFLSKPCDADVLRAALTRAAAIRGLITDPRLRQLVGGLASVPILAQRYGQLSETLGRADLTSDELAKLIESDPALSAKLLQVVNAAETPPRETVSAHEAIAVMGLDFLRSLLAGAAFFEHLGDPPAELHLERLQNGCVEAGRLARALPTHDRELARESFWAGLLQEVGWVVLAHAFPDRCVAIERSGATGAARCAAEKEAFTACHCEVGAYVLGICGAPAAVVEAIRGHGGCAAVTESEVNQRLTAANQKAMANGAKLRCRDRHPSASPSVAVAGGAR